MGKINIHLLRATAPPLLFAPNQHQMKTMKRLRAGLCMGTAFACLSLDALATTWPKLNASTPVQCGEALQIARTAFNSDAFLLYAPPEIPDNFPSSLVLQPEALDISRGNALVAAETVFDKLHVGGAESPRSIFWQKSAIYGRRLVVVETPMGGGRATCTRCPRSTKKRGRMNFCPRSGVIGASRDSRQSCSTHGDRR